MDYKEIKIFFFKKKGNHLLCYSGSRLGHRKACFYPVIPHCAQNLEPENLRHLTVWQLP